MKGISVRRFTDADRSHDIGPTPGGLLGDDFSLSITRTDSLSCPHA